MDLLEQYGWNDFFGDYNAKNRANTDFQIGRVISVRGFIYHLITLSGESEAELAGKLMYGTVAELLPGVGDWVYYLGYDTRGYIVDVFPRMNALTRKNPGNTSEKQVLAANVDYALIVQGLDRDFNLMRLDRYLVQVMACGIQPVVILNKSDLTDDPDVYLHEVARLGRDCPVYCCSTYSATGLDALYGQVLKEGKTYLLVGSSGVGKSSLVNSLMDSHERLTGSISVSTRKGRHVTNTRDLMRLPDGSLLIDTPGMREFGLTMDEDMQQKGLFPVIDRIAESCRYADCLHLNEDGCAVIRAYEDRSLDASIYESYLKLFREQKRYQIRAEDRKRMGKQAGKMSREANEFRKRYKY
jgi:ribosome biogenesis GTPase